MVLDSDLSKCFAAAEDWQGAQLPPVAVMNTFPRPLRDSCSLFLILHYV